MAHGRPSYRVDSKSLRALRESAGLSLKAFSEECKEAGHGIAPSQVSRYENGKHQPRPAALKAMAKVLRVPVTRLLKDAA
ncbi:helix-turn-helix domain-containing protein [Amycolatopsis pigmentata]|uniref:Helix-turn-helix domain-containing protein n=1 Tax=Amycolatopsis pigmentata TaxID=450801 RepID=A0ABW5G3M8_9PSEU